MTLFCYFVEEKMKKFLSIAFAIFGLLLVSVIIPSCYMDWEQFVPDDHNPSEKTKEPQTMTEFIFV